MFSDFMSIPAQNINPDTLNLEQANQYLVKAEKMRNAGQIVTLIGVGVVVIGYCATAIWASTGTFEGWGVFQALIPLAVGAYVGIPTSLIGISLWATGAGRKKKAELTLRKFNLPPENSMALGVGITIRF